jgi:hypothetical protein
VLVAGDAEQHKEQRQKPSSGPSERTRAAAAQAARTRREGRQRPKDEPEPQQAEASEGPAPDSTEAEPEQPAPRPSWRRRILMALPMVIAGIALIGYFVWLCLEMSSSAPFGGSALPAGIFGGVIVGGLAGAAGIKSAR